ncbi:MAG: PKD domain-containing protein [Bacteroidales bacterium]
MKSKSLFLCTGLCILFLAACSKDEDKPAPKASFTVNADNPEAFDTVFFTSTSQNAVKYEWDFGDGATSTSQNPIHIYQNTGSVEVMLNVWNAENVLASTSKTLTITDPTLLELYLIMTGTTDPVVDCPVMLFTSEDDMWAVENPVDGDMSDEDGWLIFKAKPIVYYVMALKEVEGGFLTNISLGYQTDVLTAHESNAYNLNMEFIADTKAGKIRDVYQKMLSRKNSTQ